MGYGEFSIALRVQMILGVRGASQCSKVSNLASTETSGLRLHRDWADDISAGILRTGEHLARPSRLAFSSVILEHFVSEVRFGGMEFSGGTGSRLAFQIQLPFLATTMVAAIGRARNARNLTTVVLTYHASGRCLQIAAK